MSKGASTNLTSACHHARIDRLLKRPRQGEPQLQPRIARALRDQRMVDVEDRAESLRRRAFAGGGEADLLGARHRGVVDAVAAGRVGVIALGIASPAFDRPPDILVSADARLIALRDGAAMRVEARSGVSAFTRDAWQQYRAAANVAPMPAVGGAVGGVVCGPVFCTLCPRAEDVAALLLRGEASRAACEAAVLVFAEPIRLRCGFWVLWVDRFSVRWEGARAIWGGRGSGSCQTAMCGGTGLGCRRCLCRA